MFIQVHSNNAWPKLRYFVSRTPVESKKYGSSAEKHRPNSGGSAAGPSPTKWEGMYLGLRCVP